MDCNNYTLGTEFLFQNGCLSSCNSLSMSGIYPQSKIENVLACPLTTDKWVQFFVPEIVDIPELKPDMEDIISINSCVEILCQRVIKTPEVTGYTNSNGEYIHGYEIDNAECTRLTGRKLIIEGLIKQKITYTALLPEQSLHSASYKIPFSVFIIIEKDTPLSKTFKVTPYIEDVYACRLSERSIFKNSTIFIKAQSIC